MNKVPGTRGYEEHIESFAAACLALDFKQVHPELYQLIPTPPVKILDVGAGVGQNAATFARVGAEVIAVEPLGAFIDIGKSTFPDLRITWLQDRLPELSKIDSNTGLFDFILLDGVWHHLNLTERKSSLKRFVDLLNPQGICAITLRNGPAGAGKHLFPTDTKELSDYADEFGLSVILQRENLPSFMKNKSQVVWAKMVLQKTS